MDAIGVELKLECRYCGNAVPLNALAPQFLCSHCLTTIKLSKKAWRSVVGEICYRVIEKKDHRLYVTGNIIPFFVQGNQCLRLYGKEEPMTAGRKKIPMAEALKSSGEGAFSFGDERISIRTVPKQFASFLFGATHLIGEDETQIPGPPSQKAKVSESLTSLVFTCPHCGGALTVDGSTRVVNCDFCKSNIFLPDPLWFRFHPAVRTKRWYLWYGNGFPDKISDADDPGRGGQIVY